VAALAVVASLWVLPLLIGPPLFSQDVYSYAAQGAMITQGINPYHAGPDALGVANAYYPYVDQLWGASPAPYGPVFMILDAGIVTLTGHHVLASVVGLRLLALGGVALLGVFLPMLARSLQRDAGTVFTLAVLNPVVLLHLIAGGHNDALMLGLLVAGLAMAQRRRPAVGIVLCALAAMVKAPAAIGIVYIGWQWAGTGVPWRNRIRPLVTAGLMSGALSVVVTAATGLGWGWVKALDNPSVVRSILDPVTAIGMLIGTMTHSMGLPIGAHLMLHVTRTLGLMGAVGCCGWLLWHSERLGLVKAVGLSLLSFVLLGPVVQPWYLAWGLVLLAPLGFGRWRPMLVGLTLVGAFIGFPGGYLLLRELGEASLWSVAVAIGVLLAIPLPPLVARIREMIANRSGRGVIHLVVPPPALDLVSPQPALVD
jgi:alpha-1,6-mannosyltransferase